MRTKAEIENKLMLLGLTKAKNRDNYLYKILALFSLM